MAASEATATDNESLVNTYHCLCTQLIVASTTPLEQLSRRGGEALDKAYILPVPPPLSTEGGMDGASDLAAKRSSPHYALLLSMTLDRKPQIVARQDGYEKRYLQRCARCRLVVGYHLDWSQWDGTGQNVDGEKKGGRRENVVYLLPGGFMGTEDMAKGKNMSKEVGLGAQA